MYEEPVTRGIHHVTPLWCAAVNGELEVCEVLVERGADVDAVSDKGSTALRSACYKSHSAVVKYLVSMGADVNRANHAGCTCLMNSIQSEDLSKFLILNGANVNARDSPLKTALHYAIEELQFGTVKLLLDHSADYLAQTKHGDDALRLACLEGCEEIANYLMDNLEYEPERIADSCELLGATLVHDNHDIGKAIDYWMKAVRYREEHNIIKDVSFPTHSVYMGLRPFRTLDDVATLPVTLDQLEVHSLMIYERGLGKNHKDTIYGLEDMGETFAGRLMYQRSIDLWKYAIDIRLLEDSVFHLGTCTALEKLVNILFDRYDAEHSWGT